MSEKASENGRHELCAFDVVLRNVLEMYKSNKKKFGSPCTLVHTLEL